MHTTVTEDDVQLMADVLVRRFADGAMRAAADFAGEHRAMGDKTRARHWDRVAAELLRRWSAPTLS